MVLNSETNFQIDAMALKNMRNSKSLLRSEESHEAFEDPENFDSKNRFLCLILFVKKGLRNPIKFSKEIFT